MKITLAQLESFHWIARLGSFSAAAKHLNLSQPAVSVRLRALERIIGHDLVRRMGRQARLTSMGTRLAEHAERILSMATEMANETLTLDPFEFKLRIGAPDSFAMVCLPSLMQSFKRKYPKVRVALTVENSSILAQRLNEGDLDIAFVAEPQLGLGVRAELLGSQELSWIVSPRFALGRSSSRPAQFAQHQIFTNPEPSKLSTLIRDWFACAGIEQIQLSTCNNLSVITRLTMSGAGVSLLPSAIVQKELKSGHLRRVVTTPKIPNQRFFACYRDGDAGETISNVILLAKQVMLRAKFLT